MTNDQIENFFTNAKLEKRIVRIDFKTRGSIIGMFIESKDSAELNMKNFWRIVNESKIEEYSVGKDTSLARIFNGSEMTKLGIIKEKKLVS